MYRIQKRYTISCAHQLQLPYESPCTRPHGHNYVITVFAESKMLNPHGMVADFSELSGTKALLDHKDLNNFLAQPTAEHLAKFIYQDIVTTLDDPSVTIMVSVKETEDTEVVYSE